MKTNMKVFIYPVSIILFSLSVCFLSITDSFAQEKRTSNTGESDKPSSGFDPKYEKIKSRVSYVPGIKVMRGETQLIVPEHKSFCPAGSVFKYSNGDIHVYDRRSCDGGKTWQQVDHILENSTYQYPEPDGEVIMFRSENSGGGSSDAGRPEVSLQKTDRKGVFEANFFRSNNNGLTRVKDPAKIFLPEELNELTGVLCRKIVRIEDGSLLVSMYSRNAKGNNIEQQFRTIALRSDDRGKTWHYFSTIAFDGK
ncbi:MAG: exo-alpha-sialidase, partial [Cyclobacteriaceae bacterium]|nr:exo-alpha-sialidase [Cyclobacteriaceae bacterium]